MKTLIAFLTGVLFFTTGTAQPELVKTSLSPMGGQTQTATQIEISTAGGEVFNAESNAGNIHLSEGFIGPDVAHILKTEDYAVLEGLHIYPNPVKDKLQIAFPGENHYEIYLHDLTGKEIYSSTSEGALLNIPMRHYRTGIYLLTVIDRENREYVTYKIQKIKSL